MTAALRKAIERDGRTWAAIARAGGLDKGMVSRFMHRERTLTLETADQLCHGLAVDVRLVPRRGKAKKGGR